MYRVLVTSQWASCPARLQHGRRGSHCPPVAQATRLAASACRLDALHVCWQHAFRTSPAHNLAVAAATCTSARVVHVLAVQGSVPAHIQAAAQRSQEAANLRAANEDAVAPGKPADANLLAAYMAYIAVSRVLSVPQQ